MSINILDDSTLDIPFMSPICSFCVHWRTELIRGCDAYPTKNGIPLEIWKGHASHDTPFPGDNGIVFLKGFPE